MQHHSPFCFHNDTAHKQLTLFIGPHKKPSRHVTFTSLHRVSMNGMWCVVCGKQVHTQHGFTACIRRALQLTFLSAERSSSLDLHGGVKGPKKIDIDRKEERRKKIMMHVVVIVVTSE